MALSGSAWKHASSSGASIHISVLWLRLRSWSRRWRWPPPRPVRERRLKGCSGDSERSSAGPRRAHAAVVSCLCVFGSRCVRALAAHDRRRRGSAVPLGLASVSLCGGAHACQLCVAVISVCSSPYLLDRHRMMQDYPLNLSISLSGGEETNQDALSNGE